MELLLFVILPLAIMLPFGLFKARTREHLRQVEVLTAQLADEPAERQENCIISFKSETPLPRLPQWKINREANLYHTPSAHIYLHANGIVIMGFVHFNEMPTYAEPFYIWFNENRQLEAKLVGIKKVQLRSLQAFGNVIQVEFDDPDHPSPILLTIKNMKLPRQDRTVHD